MTLQNDLWSAKLPNGEVRAGTLEQLGEAFRAGLIGEATPVCAVGSDQWAKLVDILAAAASPARAAGGSVAPRPSTAPSPAAATGDLWQVRLASGEVRTGTRQQLEEAIVAGHLTADLLALPSGATSWRALGTVLAGSVPPPPRPVSVAPSAAAPPPSSAAPAAPSPPLPASDDAWQVRLPDGQIRAGTRAQLEEAVRAGHLDASFLVLAAGAVEWTPLSVAIAPPTPEQAVAPPAELAPAGAETPLAPDTLDSLPGGNPGEETPVTNAADGAEPLWQVQLPERQLEAAFEAGLLGDDALVMPVGTDHWLRLGDVKTRLMTGRQLRDSGT
jgi:hypothetical protein